MIHTWKYPLSHYAEKDNFQILKWLKNESPDDFSKVICSWGYLAEHKTEYFHILLWLKEKSPKVFSNMMHSWKLFASRFGINGLPHVEQWLKDFELIVNTYKTEVARLKASEQNNNNNKNSRSNDAASSTLTLEFAWKAKSTSYPGER